MPDSTGVIVNKMKIAVLSGKGGTGKTMLSVNLAAVAENCTYIDCDVEEPNGHLFFSPINIVSDTVTIRIPKVDQNLCTACRKCIDICKFNALAYISQKLFVFDSICHACGACSILCPENAISEVDKKIGVIQTGISENVLVKTGILNVGESSGVPIIKKIMNAPIEKSDFVFIDCPPGSACIVMESIKDADFCILIAEPTIFGAHNLNMVYELVKLFNKPFGVILNKFMEGVNPSEDFCLEKKVNILGKIPYCTELGMLNSNGKILVRENSHYKKMFADLLQTVISEVQNQTIINS